MLWIKSFHIIAMVCWFSGLFYLPRLFVYHALATDTISIERFKIMEKKLYYYITTPAAVITLLLGGWLIGFNVKGYMQAPWMHMKLGLVLLLVAYHVYLGVQLKGFADGTMKHGAKFFRMLNEVPLIFLAGIVILVVVRPI